MEIRPIDANALNVEEIPCYYGESCRVDDVKGWLEEAPTLDYEPVRHGEWVDEIEPNVVTTSGRDVHLWRCSAQRNGDIVVVRMTGGPDCLWLNMYLDTEAWQMTCDSDIGSYSYRWPRGASEYGFLELCTRWLANEEWLLRKCIGEYRVEKFFDKSTTLEAMCEMFKEYYEAEADEDDEIPDYEGMLDDICYDDRDSWCAALVYSAPYYGVELPEEWWTHIAEDYTPWQKRFAEICREVIVPELKKMDGGK